MPRIKRVILWEGNPNDLPNRKVKSNKESILLTNSLLIM